MMNLRSAGSRFQTEGWYLGRDFAAVYSFAALEVHIGRVVCIGLYYIKPVELSDRAGGSTVPFGLRRPVTPIPAQ